MPDEKGNVQELSDTEKAINKELDEKYKPSINKLKQAKDAGVTLKEQIHQSELRRKAMKCGNSIKRIAPKYKDEFYLPEKELYVDKKKQMIKEYSESIKKQRTLSTHGRGS